MKKVLITLAVFLGLFIFIGMLPDKTQLKDSQTAPEAAPAVMDSATKDRLDLAAIELRLVRPGFRFAGWRPVKAGTCFRYTSPDYFGVRWGFMTNENTLILNNDEALSLCE